jgi:peptidoglycan hydrolase-like protein with peptidoglycan-binding domain
MRLGRGPIFRSVRHQAGRAPVILVITALSTLALAASSTVAAASVGHAGERVHVVQRGESLWSIATERVGAHAGRAKVAAAVERTAALNARQLPRGRDLILPGQRLRLPSGAPPREHRSSARRISDARIPRTPWVGGPVGLGAGFHRTAGSARVKEIQRRLGCAGYQPGPVDGRFGAATLTAVRAFQRARGLAVDGIVGSRTIRSLRAACPARTRRPVDRRAKVDLPAETLPVTDVAPARAPAATRLSAAAADDTRRSLWLWFAACAAASGLAALIGLRRRRTGAGSGPPAWAGPSPGRVRPAPPAHPAPTEPLGRRARAAAVPAPVPTPKRDPVRRFEPASALTLPLPPEAASPHPAQTTALLDRPEVATLIPTGRAEPWDAIVGPHTRPAGPSVSVVIPSLNHARALATILPRLPRGLHEVIVVDRGSVDGTPAVARRLRPDADVVQRAGSTRGAALACGFERTHGDILVTLDPDRPGDGDEILRLVSALRAGAAFAKGSRFLPTAPGATALPARARLERSLTGLANALFGTRYTDLRHGSSAVWRDALPELDLEAAGPEAIPLLHIRVAEAGLAVAEVPSGATAERAARRRVGRPELRLVRALVKERVARGKLVALGAGRPVRADAAPIALADGKGNGNGTGYGNGNGNGGDPGGRSR